MKLKNFQKECIEKINAHFEKNTRQLIQLPTGSGKTVIFTYYLSKFCKRSLILVPTIELLEQVVETGLNFMHKSQIKEKYYSANHVVTTAASLNYESTIKKALNHNPEIIVIDEAHKAYSNTYLNFIKIMKANNPKIKIIGFTATPERHDKQPLMEIFKAITYKKTIYDLIKQGDLCNVECYRIFTKNKFNTRRTSAGDFAPIALKELNEESRNELILKTYEENCKGSKTLIFCVSVEHAKTMAEYFKEKGHAAEAIYGDINKTKRKEIISKFKNGTITILFNCQLLTEGFDEPSIKCLIFARPTKSKALYCQMLGRGLRIYPGKDCCKLYELTDNVFNISSFEIFSDIPYKDLKDFKQGITLTEMHEKKPEISLSCYEIIKKKVNIFNVFESANLIEITKSQRREAHRLNLSYIDDLTYCELAFLIWKEKLKKKREEWLLSRK